VFTAPKNQNEYVWCVRGGQGFNSKL